MISLLILPKIFLLRMGEPHLYLTADILEEIAGSRLTQVDSRILGLCQRSIGSRHFLLTITRPKATTNLLTKSIVMQLVLNLILT